MAAMATAEVATAEVAEAEAAAAEVAAAVAGASSTVPSPQALDPHAGTGAAQMLDASGACEPPQSVADAT
eukprot:2186523-Pleurochrysis_carterae.AAC.1